MKLRIYVLSKKYKVIVNFPFKILMCFLCLCLYGQRQIFCCYGIIYCIVELYTV
jgi:hypothetical protein